jgi:hypothetical protein
MHKIFTADEWQHSFQNSIERLQRTGSQNATRMTTVRTAKRTILVKLTSIKGANCIYVALHDSQTTRIFEFFPDETGSNNASGNFTQHDVTS